MKEEIVVLSDLSEISAPFDGILLDAYGVFWGGGVGLIPGAKEMMAKLVIERKIVGILSNSTQPVQKEIVKWKAHGLIEGIHFHFAVTSREVLNQFLMHGEFPFPTPKKKFWLFGSPHPKYASHTEIFKGTVYTETADLQKAEFIFLSVPHINGEDQTDPELFREEMHKIKNCGLPMVCANPDRYAHEGFPPRPVVRQGAIAAIYEELGGEVLYIGKPSMTSYSAAMHRFEEYKVVSPAEILMVGDTPETDIRGARLSGMKSALIMETGMMQERIEQWGFEQAIQKLEPKDKPDFYIARLGKYGF